MPFTKEQIEELFTYHAPTEDDRLAYEKINAAAKHLAEVIVDVTPPCPDQSVAVRKVREARMAANSAIALKGKF